MRRRLLLLGKRSPGLTFVSVLAVVLLVSGVAGISYQTAIATRQRDLAEHRFDELRSFTNWVIFELDDILARLPGSTEARRLVVAHCVDYLDRLSQTVAPDSPARYDLARARVHLADIYGSYFTRNLGNHAQARAQYEAARLDLTGLKRQPGDRVHLLLARIAFQRHMVAEGAQPEWDILLQADRMLRETLAAQPDNLEAIILLSHVTTQIALTQLREEMENAIIYANLLEGIRLADKAYAADPDFPGALVASGWSHFWMGYTLRQNGDPRAALVQLNLAKDAWERTTIEDDPIAPLVEAITWMTLARSHAALLDRAQTRADGLRAIELLDASCEAYPQDFRALRWRESSYAHFAAALLTLVEADPAATTAMADARQARGLFLVAQQSTLDRQRAGQLWAVESHYVQQAIDEIARADRAIERIEKAQGSGR